MTEQPRTTPLTKRSSLIGRSQGQDNAHLQPSPAQHLEHFLIHFGMSDTARANFGGFQRDEIPFAFRAFGLAAGENHPGAFHGKVLTRHRPAFEGIVWAYLAAMCTAETFQGVKQ